MGRSISNRFKGKKEGKTALPSLEVSGFDMFIFRDGVDSILVYSQEPEELLLGKLKDVRMKKSSNTMVATIMYNRRSMDMEIKRTQITSDSRSPAILRNVLTAESNSIQYICSVLKKMVSLQVRSDDVPAPRKRKRSSTIGEPVKKKPKKHSHVEYNVNVGPKTIRDMKLLSTFECRKPKTALKKRRKSSFRGTVFFDLDNCLIMSEPYEPLRSQRYEHDFFISAKGITIRLGVMLRPFAREVLREVKRLNLEVICFTASHADYLEKVLKFLDPQRSIFDHVLSRDSCNEIHVRDSIILTKKISDHRRDLQTSILVDDSFYNFVFIPSNGLPVKKWQGDDNDGELRKVFGLIRELFQSHDVRVPLRKFFDLEGVVKKISLQKKK